MLNKQGSFLSAVHKNLSVMNIYSTEGEAYPAVHAKQWMIGLRAEGSRQSLGFLTHLCNAQLVLLEATEKQAQRPTFSWGGMLQPLGGKKREGREKRQSQWGRRERRDQKRLGQESWKPKNVGGERWRYVWAVEMKHEEEKSGKAAEKQL